MGGHEERLGTAQLTSRVMDWQGPRSRLCGTDTFRQALRASIELGKLGFTMRALRVTYTVHRARAKRSGAYRRPS